MPKLAGNAKVTILGISGTTKLSGHMKILTFINNGTFQLALIFHSNFDEAYS